MTSEVLVSDMRPRLKRITTTIAGIAAVCLIVFLCRFWQEIQIEWHLYRLRDHPGYFKEIINTPENSAEIGDHEVSGDV